MIEIKPGELNCGRGFLTTSRGWREMSWSKFSINPEVVRFQSQLSEVLSRGIYNADGMSNFSHSYTEKFTFPLSPSLLTNRTCSHLLPLLPIMWLSFFYGLSL